MPPQSQIHDLIKTANAVLLGKEAKIKLALATLLANGHLLINDIPGVGKTTLANLLARLVGLYFQRIQFTSDLLPADITGVSIFDPKAREFEFHPGPIFAQLVLADEINRATPRTQSALLEAMEERQVSCERKTRALPTPFFVIATQNPDEHTGTFALPESQLDRFMTCMDIGYPDQQSERDMLSANSLRDRMAKVPAVMDAAALAHAQKEVAKVRFSDALMDYLQALIAFSRNSERFISGYSPRAGMGLVALTRAWAYLHGRKAAIPEDLQAVIPATIHHLRPVSGKVDATDDLLKRVAIP